MKRESMNMGGVARAARALALAAGVSVSAAAFAGSYSFTAFNPGAVGNNWMNQDLTTLAGGSIPVNTWVGYDIEVDWTGGDLGVNSADLRAVFSATAVSGTTQNFPFSGGGTKYTNSIPRMPDNGFADNSNSNSVRFRGGFTTNYGGGTPLNLAFRHQFAAGANTPQWNNVRVTLYDNYDEMLGVTDLGVLGAGTTTVTDTYTRRDAVRWYKFSVGEDIASNPGKFLSIDTIGNSLTGGGQGDSDTQMFIFNPVTGAMIWQNNDFTINGDLHRESLFVSGDVSASSFADANGYAYDSNGLFANQPLYLVVAPSGITEQFGQKFTLNGAIDLATPGTDLMGSYTINFRTNVPTPGTVGVLGLGGVLAIRRRR